MGLLQTAADACLVQIGKTEPAVLVRHHPEYQRSYSQITPFTQCIQYPTMSQTSARTEILYSCKNSA